METARFVGEYMVLESIVIIAGLSLFEVINSIDNAIIRN